MHRERAALLVARRASGRREVIGRPRDDQAERAVSHAAEVTFCVLNLVLLTQSLERELEGPQAIVERDGVMVEHLDVQRAGEEAAQHALRHEGLIELRRERAAMGLGPELAIGRPRRRSFRRCSLWRRQNGWRARYRRRRRLWRDCLRRLPLRFTRFPGETATQGVHCGWATRCRVSQ